MNGHSAPKRSQRRFALTKPQVTIYRKRGQCVLHRAQPQICAKKLTIRTKYQAGANCSRRRHQQTRSKPEENRGGTNERRKKKGKGTQQGTRLEHLSKGHGRTPSWGTCLEHPVEREGGISAPKSVSAANLHAAPRNISLQLLQVIACIHIEQFPLT